MGRGRSTRRTPKRPAAQKFPPRAFILSCPRFPLVGDVASEWAHFGGTSAHLSHIGELPPADTAGNPMAAIAYGKSTRAVVETNSGNRISDEARKQLIERTTDQRDETKKAVLRDGSAPAEIPRIDPQRAIMAEVKGDTQSQKGQKRKRR